MVLGEGWGAADWLIPPEYCSLTWLLPNNHQSSEWGLISTNGPTLGHREVGSAAREDSDISVFVALSGLLEWTIYHTHE